MLLAVMSSSTDDEPSLALAGIIIAFGLLLIAVLVGTLRARTVVDASGLHLRGPFGRQRNLTWEEARGRIWVNTITAHPFPITTSTIVVATDTKEVTLPSAVRQSLRRSSAERKAKELADRIIAMDPMTR
ncbi:hypothetical protein MANAM107_17170 [Actinomyces capricornis]|uniref:PH domain-containing protein n=2 Tax=Actinomyces capricornis TaxID=2755559 RepID=A0ABM7UCA7_9ACTO|nr:hypothetical protein MANAM107_17170 [Actinomyces capricornis]